MSAPPTDTARPYGSTTVSSRLAGDASPPSSSAVPSLNTIDTSRNSKDVHEVMYRDTDVSSAPASFAYTLILAPKNETNLGGGGGLNRRKWAANHSSVGTGSDTVPGAVTTTATRWWSFTGSTSACT